jgi:hypothetical protein
VGSFTVLVRAVTIAGLLGLLAGCDTLWGSSGPLASAAPAELSPAAASAIATDMVSRLTGQLGPGANTIVLKEDGSSFGLALEQALKTSGYAVVTDQPFNSKAGVALSYIVDGFDGGVLARLSTPAVDLGRAYQVTASGATPSSPLSVMAHGAPA